MATRNDKKDGGITRIGYISSMVTSHERRRFLRTLSLGSLATFIGNGSSRAQAAVKVTPKLKFLTQESKGYDDARQLFNSRLNFRPALIAKFNSGKTDKTEKEIAAAFKHAHLNKLQVTVKSGGHSFEGFSSNNGGMMVSLSAMTGMEYDAKTKTVKAQPGCRLGQVGSVLLSKGRLLPSGSCAGVGLAGLTLGGGYGLFARKHGLTCDHLTGLRMVDGKGDIHDSDDDPEKGAKLLKVCRGGGNGNFGIITELRFSTVAAPKLFSSQRIRYRKLTPEKVGELAKLWFTATTKLPNDGFSAFVLNGSSLTVLITFFDKGTRAYVEKAFQPMRDKAWRNEAIRVAPTASAITRYYGRPGPLPFKNASAGYYRDYDHIAKSIPAIAKQVARVSGTVWQINTLGGAINTLEFEKQSVYPHRAYPWLGEIQGYWDNIKREGICVENVATVQKLITACGVTDHYRNYPDIDFKNSGKAYYGESGLEQISEMKKLYDPDNTIHHPQSVKAN
jgi:FAD/FMN-containing dehydrogenase